VLTTLWQSKQAVRNPQEEKEERDAGEQQRHAPSIQLLSLNATRLKIEPETVISSLANCQWTVYGLRTTTDRSIDILTPRERASASLASAPASLMATQRFLSNRRILAS